MSEETKDKELIKRAKLSNQQVFTLYKWVELNNGSKDDLETQAKKASKQLGFKLSKSHISGARRQLGIVDKTDERLGLFIKDLEKLIKKYK